MTRSEPLLSVRDLTIGFSTGGKVERAVDRLSFDVMHGEFLALVGESGCGKSITALSVLRLLPEPAAKVLGGTVLFSGADLLRCSSEDLRRIRGKEIAMVFQEPMTSLNPVLRVGDQVAEAVRIHERVGRKEARDRTVEALRKVGVPDPERRYDDYPHLLSGGLRQRVMIAMALVNGPKLLLADEPTTALDVTLQAEILDLLHRLREEAGLSVLLISHDLSVVMEVCDRVAVMYAGVIVETASAVELSAAPMHPYTKALFKAVPAIDSGKAGGRLESIPGRVPPLGKVPPYCRFFDRCALAEPVCKEREPDLREVSPGHWARCVKA